MADVELRIDEVGQPHATRRRECSSRAPQARGTRQVTRHGGGPCKVVEAKRDAGNIARGVEEPDRRVDVVDRLWHLAEADQACPDHVQGPRLHGLIADPPEEFESLSRFWDAMVRISVEVAIVADAPESGRQAVLITDLAVESKCFLHLGETYAIRIARGRVQGDRPLEGIVVQRIGDLVLVADRAPDLGLGVLMPSFRKVGSGCSPSLG